MTKTQRMLKGRKLNRNLLLHDCSYKEMPLAHKRASRTVLWAEAVFHLYLAIW